jgi:hypothetical protein
MAPATPSTARARARSEFNATPSALPPLSSKHSTSYGSSLAVSPVKMVRYEINDDLDDVLEELVPPALPPTLPPNTGKSPVAPYESTNLNIF